MTDPIIIDIREFIKEKGKYVYMETLADMKASLNMLKNYREFILNEDYTTSSIHHDEFPDMYETDEEWYQYREYIEYIEYVERKKKE